MWLKGDEQLLAEVAQRRGGVCVCLDENGSELASAQARGWGYGGRALAGGGALPAPPSLVCPRGVRAVAVWAAGGGRQPLHVCHRRCAP